MLRCLHYALKLVGGEKRCLKKRNGKRKKRKKNGKKRNGKNPNKGSLPFCNFSLYMPFLSNVLYHFGASCL
jgi:hypothetical protein